MVSCREKGRGGEGLRYGEQALETPEVGGPIMVSCWEGKESPGYREQALDIPKVRGSIMVSCQEKEGGPGL